MLGFEFKTDILHDPDQVHQHDTSIVSVVCRMEGEVNIRCLQNWIERLIEEDGADFYCYRGIMAVKGMPKKFVFQGVDMLHTRRFEGAWKNDEARVSRFVFIGKNLDKEFLQGGFSACRVTQDLRFPVGALVEVNVGKWKKGIVLRHWDDGHAYRVEVQDKKKNNVWAPVDIDGYIRPLAN